MTEEEDLQLALKEMRRQQNAAGLTAAEREILDLRPAEEMERKFRSGEISAQEFQTYLTDFEAQIESFREQVEEQARERDDAGILMSQRASSEANAKGHGQTAQLLVTDAFHAAEHGQTHIEWIVNVLEGHSGDQKDQLGCLTEIVNIWTNGPWPWREMA